MRSGTIRRSMPPAPPDDASSSPESVLMQTHLQLLHKGAGHQLRLSGRRPVHARCCRSQVQLLSQRRHRLCECGHSPARGGNLQCRNGEQFRQAGLGQVLVHNHAEVEDLPASRPGPAFAVSLLSEPSVQEPTPALHAMRAFKEDRLTTACTIDALVKLGQPVMSSPSRDALVRCRILSK